MMFIHLVTSYEFVVAVEDAEMYFNLLHIFIQILTVNKVLRVI